MISALPLFSYFFFIRLLLNALYIKLRQHLVRAPDSLRSERGGRYQALFQLSVELEKLSTGISSSLAWLIISIFLKPPRSLRSANTLAWAGDNLDNYPDQDLCPCPSLRGGSYRHCRNICWIIYRSERQIKLRQHRLVVTVFRKPRWWRQIYDPCWFGTPNASRGCSLADISRENKAASEYRNPLRHSPVVKGQRLFFSRSAYDKIIFCKLTQ